MTHLLYKVATSLPKHLPPGFIMRCPGFILLLLAPATTLYVGPQQLVAHRPGRLRRCAPPVASDRIADSHRKHAMRKQIKRTRSVCQAREGVERVYA